MSHTDTAPTHISPRKHSPERLSTTRPRTHLLALTHSECEHRGIPGAQTPADTGRQAGPLRGLTHTTQLTCPDTEALR